MSTQTAVKHARWRVGWPYKLSYARRRTRCALRNAMCAVLGHKMLIRRFVQSYDEIHECQRCHKVLDYGEVG